MNFAKSQYFLLIPFSFLIYTNMITAYCFFLIYEGFQFKNALKNGCV